MILLAILAFYGGMFLGCVALVVHAMVAPAKTAQTTSEHTQDRAHSAALSGLLLAVGFAGVWVLAKTLGAVHIVVAPFLVTAALLYLVGYMSPTWIRVPVETKIRHYLDYLDFTLPGALLPVVGKIRRLLTWLGLSVG